MRARTNSTIRIGAIASLALAGCTIEAPDFASKRCPCAPGSGLVCDSARDVCVASTTPGQAGAVTVTDFRAIWTTDESIRWQWDPGGDESAFSRYQLETATSEEELLAGDGTVWTAEQNPELGLFRLPHTGEGDVLIATTTDGHPPLGEIFARLTAIDTQQQASVSNVASASTQIAVHRSAPLFVDQLANGEYLFPPDEAVVTAEIPFAGAACIAYPHSCGDGIGSCGAYVGVSGLRPELASQMTAGEFATTAYLELAIAHDGTAPSFWSTIRVRTGSGDGLLLSGYAPFTIRGGDPTSPAADYYRRYQVPLRMLRHPFVDGTPMTFEELQDGLYQVVVDGDWTDGAEVRLDEIWVRW